MLAQGSSWCPMQDVSLHPECPFPLCSSCLPGAVYPDVVMTDHSCPKPHVAAIEPTLLCQAPHLSTVTRLKGTRGCWADPKPSLQGGWGCCQGLGLSWGGRGSLVPG